jgi:hypothetical protein
LSAARDAEVSVLRLGSMVWVAVPVEPSEPSGRQLERDAQADRLVSLANGYLGYLEPRAQAVEAAGESKRQYYAPQLQEALGEAAKLAGAAVR